MNLSCPNKECGRKFTQEADLLAHLKRRHPNENYNIDSMFSKTVIFKQKKIEEEISKLPRIKLRPSQQKPNKQKQNNSNNTKKIITAAEIVTHTRLEVKKNESSTRQVFKRNSSKNSINKKDSLPSLQYDNPYMIPKKLSGIEPEQKNKLSNTVSEIKLTKKNSLSKLDDFSKDLQIGGQSKQIVKKRLRKQPLNKTSSGFPVKQMESQNIRNKQTIINSQLTQNSGLDVAMTQSEIIKQQQNPVNYEQNTRILVIRNSLRIFKPTFLNLQSLYLNNTGVAKICLDGLQCLEEFSATHNNLTNMNFLKFEDNENLKIVHLDSNKISELYLPPNIKSLTMAFNKIINLQQICNELTKSKICEVDFSFNPVKKLYNYKLELLLKGKHLNKIDGMKITKIDIDMALEYRGLLKKDKIISKQANMSYYDRFHKKIDSEQIVQSNQKISEQQYVKLEKELADWQQKSKDVEEGLQIITTENDILKQQIKNIELEQINNDQLDKRYEQLKIELETLELMNFLQYSDKSEIEEMIKSMRKKILA